MLRATVSHARRQFSSVSHDKRLRALVRSIDAASPAHVWDAYTDIISVSGPASLPVDIHRNVLRLCSDDKDFHKNALRSRMAAGSFIDPTHIHESRFKVVMDNIVSLTDTPSVDDFNFVLDHMAAIGYFPGVLSVYQRMKALGVKPTDKTFEACFRAITTRLFLPIPPHLRPDVVAYATARFQDLMADHHNAGLRMTPTNMELALRILKETLDVPSFLRLLRTSFALDLDNPDRIALEYADENNKSVPLLFSTAALNTTLNMLGTMGDISRMVVAFEVLTDPLPQAAGTLFNTFADDHDDLGAGPRPRVQPPSAVPNATTYTILIRHIARADNHALARHYLLRAIREGRHAAWSTRHQIVSRLARGKPLDDVRSPRLTIGWNVIVPVLGVANRHKNLTLLEWLTERMPGLKKRVKSDLAFYENLLRRLKRAGVEEVEFVPPEIKERKIGEDGEEGEAGEEGEEEMPMVPPPPKMLHISTHIYVLRRTLAELEQLAPRIVFDFERARQRVKERLGRRVWDVKDVYVRDDDQRLLLEKERWKKIVAFKKPSKELVNMTPLRPQGTYVRRGRGGEGERES